ncbi:PRA1 family protein H-like isoform X2 [Capsella rubella]|uniref:PRA1 family protein H-like isoform X2 n=1 Tax=Capsella rubella TaxID=81985 RepID=UPI000CD516F6|nr:PRA1 family protein H-like isoform X2 [Capsella rubella]
MAFSPNPLSLSASDPAFEPWLRDSGCLELLDHRTSAAASSSNDSRGTTLCSASSSSLVHSSLALWELFKFCSDIWKFDHHPSMRKFSIGIGQCGELKGTVITLAT